MNKNYRLKRKILKALGDRKEVIHVEICKSEYVPGKFNMRIGDLKGSTESSNIGLKEILAGIEDEIISSLQ